MGLIVDCFAGGGGESVGIEQAMGRPVDIAINHDPQAVAMHKINHPFTKHYTEDVWVLLSVAIVIAGIVWAAYGRYQDRGLGGLQAG